MFCCHPRCEGHGELIAALTDISHRLARIERAVIHEGVLMSELDDKLTTLENAVEALSEDEARELADLQALQTAGQTLTADQSARLDALVAKVQADEAAIDAVDAPPVEPTDAPAV